MGLDYSIELKASIVDRKSGEMIKSHEYEIAYWCKHWYLCQQVIHNEVRNLNPIRVNDDYLIESDTEILGTVRDLILMELQNPKGLSFTDCYWNRTTAYQQTLQELGKIQATIDFLEDEIDDNDFVEIVDCKKFLDFGDELGKLLGRGIDCKVKYTIVFYNSY